MTTRLSFFQRLWGACRLHADTYEEIGADPPALRQAAGVMAVVVLCTGVGAWLETQTWRTGPSDSAALALIVARTLEPLVLWLGGSAFAYMVGATFLRGPETETDYAEVLRTVGFAFAPGVLFLFGFLSPAPLGLAILGIGRAWVLVASIVAVRQALDFSTWRAIGTFGAASIILWLVVWGLAVVPLPV